MKKKKKKTKQNKNKTSPIMEVSLFSLAVCGTNCGHCLIYKQVCGIERPQNRAFVIRSKVNATNTWLFTAS